MAAHPLDGTMCRLTAYRHDGVLGAAPEEVEVTLTFEATLVMGSSGCNCYVAPVAVDHTAIHFSPLASTRMMCPPPRIDLEQAYLAALQAASAWERTEAMLELRDSAGNVALVFAPTGSMTGSTP